MKRHEWGFEFTASDISKAAAKKAEWHASRAVYWRTQLKVAESQLHEQDAEGDAALDTLANVTSNYGGLRDKAQSRVVDVRAKAREHRLKVGEYRLWQELLDRPSRPGLSDTFILHRDDVEYFNLLAVVDADEAT